jgi:hypothetical protein
VPLADGLTPAHGGDEVVVGEDGHTLDDDVEDASEVLVARRAELVGSEGSYSLRF